MTSSKLTNFATVFNFTLNVSTLNSSNPVYSPLFALSNMNWRVKFSKTPIEVNTNAEALSVFLEPLWGKKEGVWLCDAKATYTLLPNDERNGPSIARQMRTKTFDNRNKLINNGFVDFIKWDEFERNYVQKDVANFKVEVSTSPLLRKRTAPDEINQTSAKFQISVENASQLGRCHSDDVVLQGMKWSVELEKKNDHLTVYLFCKDDNLDENWIYKTKVTFTLLSFHEDVEPVDWTMESEFQRGLSMWGYNKFLEWSEFIDEENGYIVKDVAILSVDLKVDPAVSRWKIPRKTQTNDGQSNECKVCHEEFVSGEIYTIGCGHLFCKPCIKTSLKYRNTCPAVCNAISTGIHPIYF